MSSAAVHVDPSQLGNPAGLTDLDRACSMPLGCSGEPVGAAAPATLQEVCERIFAPSFRRGRRCCIPFSGGIESSMWLAAGVAYARRNGYPDPVALTLRHPGLATAEHLRAQERTIAHLGLADWERIEAGESLDLVGPLARDVLAQTGPLWPPHAFMMAPLIEAARDGVFVLVTGLSDFFAWWRWAALVSVLQRRRRPGRADLTMLAWALAPVAVRARALARRRVVAPMGWLTDAAHREATALLHRRIAEVPLRCDHAIGVQTTHRCFAAAAHTLEAIGELSGTRVDQPLQRPGTIQIVAAAAGPRGYDGLGSVLRGICGDLLPARLLSTGRGPDLTPVFFGEASREFATAWSGAGLDASIVDAEALRREWLRPRPDPRTACLLQYAWLTDRRRHGLPRTHHNVSACSLD